mgnify:CR=1 FL=1
MEDEAASKSAEFTELAEHEETKAQGTDFASIIARMGAREAVDEVLKDLHYTVFDEMLFFDSKQFIKEKLCATVSEFVAFNFICAQFEFPEMGSVSIENIAPIDVDSWHSGELELLPAISAPSTIRQISRQLLKSRVENNSPLSDPVIFNLDGDFSIRNEEKLASAASPVAVVNTSKHAPHNPHSRSVIFSQAKVDQKAQFKLKNIETKNIFELPMLTKKCWPAQGHIFEEQHQKR